MKDDDPVLCVHCSTNECTHREVTAWDARCDSCAQYAMSITDQLRQLARESSDTQRQIGTASGVPQPTLSAFLAGGGLNSINMDRLARYFMLELRTVARTRSRQ